MTKELIENLRSVGRLWEDEAADLIELLQRENEKLKNYVVQRQWEAENIELAAAQAREAKLREALEKCIDGFEYTRQYVGYEMLPAIAGWSWFDAVVAAKEALAQTEFLK